MNRLFIVFLIAVPLLTGNIFAQNKNLWTAEITYSSENLGSSYPALLYAFVDIDPLKSFKKAIQKDAEQLAKNKLSAEALDGIIQTYWNQGVLGNVKASEAGLLNSNFFGTKTTFGTNKFYTLWLVTRAVGKNNEEYVWALEVDPEKGGKTKISLNDDNRVNYKKLVDIYNDTLEEVGQ
jgi:hypothetical protein